MSSRQHDGNVLGPETFMNQICTFIIMSHNKAAIHAAKWLKHMQYSTMTSAFGIVVLCAAECPAADGALLQEM